jgi:hypothetical protein
MKCQICPRPLKPNSALCRFHYFALKRLVGRFELWQKAVEVGWVDYLKKVEANPLTGVWVREVIAWSTASHKSKEELEKMVGKATPVPQDP